MRTLPFADDIPNNLQTVYSRLSREGQRVRAPLSGRRVLAHLHDNVLREMVTFPALYDLLRHRSALVRVPALRRVRRGLRQHNGWI